MYSVETNKHIFKIFLPSGSHIILDLHTKRYGSIPTGNGGKKRDFRPISGYGIDHCWTVACRQHFDGGDRL